MHLEDCRQSALDGVTHALEVLDTMRKWLRLQQSQNTFWDAGKSFEDRFAVVQRDLEHLAEEVAALQPQIKDLQQVLHEHTDLTHNRRNTIITIVAAIYVPLSFATSLFGMNINTSNSAGPSTLSNWTRSWIENSPVEYQNSTRALASTIATSGTLSYSWKAFGITAACLVVTLPLSLTLGTIGRQLYRSTTHYAVYWRGLAVIPSTVFVFFSVFGMLIGHDLDPGSLYPERPYRLDTPATLRSATMAEVFIFGYWGCNGALLAFELVRIAQVMNNSRKFVYWAIMFAIFAVCITADMLGWIYDKRSYFPAMIMPWLCFAFSWFRPWWRKRKREKMVAAGTR